MYIIDSIKSIEDDMTYKYLMGFGKYAKLDRKIKLTKREIEESCAVRLTSVTLLYLIGYV